MRDVAQPGSAPEWGSGGPGFKSPRPDHFINKIEGLSIVLTPLFLLLPKKCTQVALFQKLTFCNYLILLMIIFASNLPKREMLSYLSYKTRQLWLIEPESAPDDLSAFIRAAFSQASNPVIF